MNDFMLGNEAIARGAYEAGVRLVSSYPGTPSTEITEYCAKYPEIYAEWAANEKVALEVCAGASMAGARSICCMKHVGLNVASDPLYTLAYTGVNGGLVVVVADDPGMHSSQNEQDSRMHARGSQVPMLEPSDSDECRAFTKLAFELSEKYDTPVFVRTTTRVAHARSVVHPQERVEAALKSYQKDISKWVMMPGMAKGRHVVVEKRMNDLAKDASSLPVNRVEMGDTKIGVICSGMAYQYVKEVAPEISVLKLGIVNPLPMDLIADFARQVETLYVFEELEPVIEEQVAAHGIRVTGKALTGRQGELSAHKVAKLLGKEIPTAAQPDPVPARPPVLCPGCPHRGVYAVLNKLKCTVTGDIGCYTLGALPPLSALDSTLCMGASIGMSQGYNRMLGDSAAEKTVAVLGDSTFLHSGATSLISACYNRARVTVMILDNSTTGMTGHQPNPSTGFDIHGERTTQISLTQLCEACGVPKEHIRVCDPFDMKALEAAIKEENAFDGVSVIVARRPCMLLDKKSRKSPLSIKADACRNCLSCMKLGCPAIERMEKGVRINPDLCVGCGHCQNVCPFGAIVEGSEAK